eukprot:365705-Chlamydomonas_euryale.AAC.2
MGREPGTCSPATRACMPHAPLRSQRAAPIPPELDCIPDLTTSGPHSPWTGSLPRSLHWSACCPWAKQNARPARCAGEPRRFPPAARPVQPRRRRPLACGAAATMPPAAHPAPAATPTPCQPPSTWLARTASPRRPSCTARGLPPACRALAAAPGSPALSAPTPGARCSR